MSEDVLSKGFMVVLATPVMNYSSEEREALQEKLDRICSLEVNDEGTLVYSREDSEDAYGIHFADDRDTTKKSITTFAAACTEMGLEIQIDTLRAYNCVWYNGSDSDMALMTKEEFLAATGQSDG